jgi:hypothetical protein
MNPHERNADLRIELEHVTAQRNRYRAALEHIAYVDSGPWGWIAWNALHPEKRRPYDDGAGDEPPRRDGHREPHRPTQ